MTIGVFMLTIGTFLGGVWANESWGRYWGWDPKETWALLAILVYAIILHLRFIPGLKSKFLLSSLAFWGYSSILFTFFGVNYFLVGMHSYANGEGVQSMPNWVMIMIYAFGGLTVLAYIRYRMFKKKSIQ
jgi:ABC-type transport system involved in cytochrome c biogenesis permease subunit